MLVAENIAVSLMHTFMYVIYCKQQMQWLAIPPPPVYEQADPQRYKVQSIQ